MKGLCSSFTFFWIYTQCSVENLYIRDQMSKIREGSDKKSGKSQSDARTLTKEITSSTTRVTYQAIREGSRQLKKEYRDINVDDIENVQDDLAAILNDVDDIQGALGQSYYLDDLDDDEINAELDALGEEIAVDDDSSYLDDVLKAPKASKNKIYMESDKLLLKSNDKRFSY
ncbi:hypothetical protein FQR65_LT00107 [Abscondita terminalis]|nr:hypothetical protein FQR65_LT00107 [Abscondita terminalis]